MEKNVQIKDMAGNDLFPKTKAELVEGLNGIEIVKVNGVALQIVNKSVDITMPAASEYAIAKAETAEDGFSATYQLTKDGEPVGAKINIAKDMVVQSGAVKVCEAANTPVSGYKKGDKYIDLLLANSDDQHVYVLVSDLVDTYVAGNGIKIEGNSIAVDSAILEGKADKATSLEGYGIEDAYTKDEADAKFLTAHQDISGKADKGTTLSAYGITDALTFAEIV